MCNCILLYMKLLPLILLLMLPFSPYGREWKSLRQYNKEHNSSTLAEGHWLKKDRKKDTHAWHAANKYNLLRKDGYSEYSTFSQKRDFYKWLDDTRFAKGHEVKWAGNAYIITKQLVALDYWPVRVFVIHDKKFMQFVRKSNALILKNIYPDMRDIYTMKKPLTGNNACHWDSVVIYKEQCEVLDTLYDKQPERVLKRFNRMAAGKGIYTLVVPRKMRMKGDIRDCKTRCSYGLHTMSVFYDHNHCRK